MSEHPKPEGDHSAEYAEGWLDYFNEVPLGEQPYPIQSVEGQQWEDGHCDALAFDERDPLAWRRISVAEATTEQLRAELARRESE